MRKNSDNEIMKMAESELYTHWLKINEFIPNGISIKQFIKFISKKIKISYWDVANLYKIDKLHPGSTIINISGVPILNIKE